MNEFKYKISKVEEKNDLTVIYKDDKGQLHDLKTEKEEFLKSLRYFERQKREIETMKHVYICENISIKYFEQFFSSITTKEIALNNENYEILYQLSKKYEYKELNQQICQFIQDMPDLHIVVDELTDQKNDDNIYDPEKEEIISKNLDISIKNGILNKIPLKMLTRIVNHPSRVINDYHLLTRFIIDTIKKYQNEAETNQNYKNHLHLLPGCLDYCMMSSKEIIELFSIENDRHFFSPDKSKEKIEEMISKEQEMHKKLSDMNEKVLELENETKNLKNQITENIEKQNNEICERIDKIEGLLKMKEKSHIEELSKINEKLTKIENENGVKNSNILDRINQIEALLKTKETSHKEEISDQNLRFSKIEDQCKRQNNEICERIEELFKKISEENKNRITECNGIFQYLIDIFKTNPVNNGFIKIDGNSYGDNMHKDLINLIDCKWGGSGWASKDNANSYIKIEFVKSFVKINRYRLVVGNSDGTSYFKSWVLTGVTSNNQTVVLDEVNNAYQIHDYHTTIIREVSCNENISEIILTMKGNCSWDAYPLRMIMKNIELFGLLLNKD